MKIKQTIRFQASVKDVFEMLMDPRKHRAFTGAATFISKKEGAAFSTYDGWCLGRNIEIVNNKRIVQAWRAKDWKPGQFSIMTLKFTSLGKQGCKVEFVQDGFPNKSVMEKTKKGWQEHYWQPMKDFIRMQKNNMKTSKTQQKANIQKSKKATKSKRVLRVA